MANDNTGFAWHQNLILTLDGRGLRDAHLVPYVHRWVKDGTSIISGHRYCAAIGLQAGELPTRERRSRGTNLEPYCDHFKPPCWEYLGHIVQGCPRTQAIRNYRHDLIVSKASRMLRTQGWQIWLEPRIPYQGTCLIPDLVMSRGDQSVVLNVTITTDCPDTPNTAHDTKVSKYVVKEVEDFVQNITGNRPNLFTACAIN